MEELFQKVMEMEGSEGCGYFDLIKVSIQLLHEFKSPLFLKVLLFLLPKVYNNNNDDDNDDNYLLFNNLLLDSKQ